MATSKVSLHANLRVGTSTGNSVVTMFVHFFRKKKLLTLPTTIYSSSEFRVIDFFNDFELKRFASEIS